MSTESHWDHIYQTKTPLETSWFTPHLQTSLDWIMAAAPDRSAAIIDIGGGESTLVDDLLARQYRALTILDVSAVAIGKSQARLGEAAETVTWIASDLLEASLPPRAYDLWHDRAVFHFFIEAAQRSAYIERLTTSLKPGGQVLLATFGPQGPQKCSGLPTMRYEAETLLQELGPDFRLVKHALADHQTPFGTTQQFLYCHFAFSPSH